MLLAPPPRPLDVAPEPERAPRAALGSGTRVWLVRHGRVDAASVAYGDQDVALSRAGERETETVAQTLAALFPSAVASSPLERARRMGRAIADAAGVPCALDERFAELHRGAWQGLERTEYAARWAAEAEVYWRDPLHWQGHGGESEAALVERAWPALVEVTERADGGIAVVTAHRQVLRAIVAAAIGIPAGRSHAITLQPAHGVLLRDAESGWILDRTNVVQPGTRPATETEDGPPEDVVTRLG